MCDCVEFLMHLQKSSKNFNDVMLMEFIVFLVQVKAHSCIKHVGLRFCDKISYFSSLEASLFPYKRLVVFEYLCVGCG